MREGKRDRDGLVDEMREVAPSLQLNNWILSREKGTGPLVIRNRALALA